MAQNIGNLDVSKTFSNVLLSNVSAPAGYDTVGIPDDLLNTTNLVRARVQDGGGSESPLLVSKSDVGLLSGPQTIVSLLRAVEMLETMTQAQNNLFII